MYSNHSASRLTTLARAGACPVIALLDSGLDPFADLPVGTSILDARSFVGESVSMDEPGTGGAAVSSLAGVFAGRWTAQGLSSCRIVLARVADARGVIQPGAVSRALSWLRTLSPRVDLVASLRGELDPDNLPVGALRTCGREGIVLALLDQVSVADFRPTLRLVA